MIEQPWAVAFGAFILLVLLGTSSGLVNARLSISEPLACAAAGITLGPIGLGWVRIDPGQDPLSASILHEAARVTLAIAVTGAAMRLPKQWFRRHWRGVAMSVGPGMVGMWLAGSAISLVTLGVPLATAFLIGAAIAPTDPVLSAPVLSGSLAERVVPADLRFGLTAESGVNDGLALPMVMLPILLLGHGPADAGVEWLLHTLLWEVGCAVVVGTAAGWLVCHGMRWASGREDAEPASLVTVALAVSMAALTGVRMLGGDGVLAAFVAGLVMNEGLPTNQAEEHQQRFNEALSRFFDLPIMILFGAVIPWQAWGNLGWRGVVFALGVLLLRRLPVWMALRRWMSWTRARPDALFAGWFGPVGAGALFYAMEVQNQTGLGEIWPIVSLAVGASVLAHGASGTPLTHLLGRARR